MATEIIDMKVPHAERNLKMLQRAFAKDDYGYRYLLYSRIGQSLEHKDFPVAAQQGDYGMVFKKADTPILTSSTGVLQVIYGKQVWDWLNRQYTMWSLLGKVAWGHSGWRVLAADGTIPDGLTETSVVPDAVMPTFAALSTKFKQVAFPWAYTRKQRLASEQGDDGIPTETEVREVSAHAHIRQLDQPHTTSGYGGLGENAETTQLALAAGYSGKNNFEAIDRIISASEEEDDIGALGNAGANSYDPWQQYASTAIDRDSGTTYDSVVCDGAGSGLYTSGTAPNYTVDATFSLSGLNALISTCEKNGLNRENAILVMGYNVYDRILQMEEAKERFINPVRVARTVNGVRSVEGTDVGVTVSSYQGIPMFRWQNCPADTLSRIFLIDLEHLFLKIVTPSLYVPITIPPQPAYMTQDSTAGLYLAEKFMYLTEGETICTKFKTQGKMRSIA